MWIFLQLVQLSSTWELTYITRSLNVCHNAYFLSYTYASKNLRHNIYLSRFVSRILGSDRQTSEVNPKLRSLPLSHLATRRYEMWSDLGIVYSFCHQKKYIIWKNWKPIETEHYPIPDTTFILSCERLLFTVYTLHSLYLTDIPIDSTISG